MVHDRASRRIKMRRAVLALISAALPFADFDGSAVQAQSIMRSPSINVGSRLPTLNPTGTPPLKSNPPRNTGHDIRQTPPHPKDIPRLQLRLSRQRRPMPGPASLIVG